MNHMQMSIIEVFICRRLHMDTSMILICIWVICRLCTALHTKCCGAVRDLVILYVIVDSSRRKQYRDGCKGSSTSRPFLKPQEYITAAINIADKVTIVNGKLEGNDV